MDTGYWINTISLEHVRIGVDGGFTQADHGRATRLRALRRGDRLAFYSPRTAMRSGAPLQQFTAIGTVVDDEPYQASMRPDFRPWRRRVEFEDVEPAAVRPLLGRLSFVTDERRWGLPFRRGLFPVSAEDFDVIAAACRVRAGPDVLSGRAEG
jgi:hypothetical protein